MSFKKIKKIANYYAVKYRSKLRKLASENDGRLSSLKRKPYSEMEKLMGYVFFEPIKIGDMTISIQAGDGNYSSPRQTKSSTGEVLEAKDYDSFEVALMEDGEFVNPNNHPHIIKGSWVKYWNGDDVAAYVPRADVEAILADIAKSYDEPHELSEDIKTAKYRSKLRKLASTVDFKDFLEECEAELMFKQSEIESDKFVHAISDASYIGWSEKLDRSCIEFLKKEFDKQNEEFGYASASEAVEKWLDEVARGIGYKIDDEYDADRDFGTRYR